MKKFRYLSSILIIISICLSVAFGGNFSFSPISGTEIKLYCEVPVQFVINGEGEKFNAFETNILFDSTNIQLIAGSVHPEFLNGMTNVISGNLYNIGGSMAGEGEDGYKMGILTGATFTIRTKNNIYSTTLSLVGKNGLDPTYGLSTTKDGITLNGYDQSSQDILTSVTNVTYNFVALPCNADVAKPTIANMSVNSGDTKVLSNQTITFLTYDWGGSKVSRWFAGNSTGNLSNYVVAPDSVDNQEGVDSSKIFVTVSCTGCSSSQLNKSATLTISDWGGETGKNALTWDSERRGYNVSFNPPFPYEVEKQVTVNISVTDNPNENGQTHTQTNSISFNTPVAPTISRISPNTDTFVSPSKSFPISFYISDDWAGVDTGNVVIKTIYSGKEFVYSGSDLDFELSGGSEGLGNAGSYRVTFYPKEDFPVLTQINLYVTGADLAGSVKTFQSSFTTRPDCSFFGCIDSVNIIGNEINQIFSGIVLSITGTNPNSPYPYLTGENNEILMCGKDWSGADILGNVYLYDAGGNRLNNVQYTGNDLFITGLDVLYQGGIIIVE